MVGATPLGGYVKISGMIDESLDTDHVESEPEPFEFRAKPVWQRIVVISAGVVFNVILAVFIFAGISWVEGESYVPAQNVEQIYVEEGSIAHDIGLRTGDRILEVNEEPFKRFEQITSPSSLVTADTLTITVRRGGETQTIVGPSDIITRLSRAQNEDNDQGFGLGYIPPVIGWVRAGTPADSVGLRSGDRVVGIEEDTVRFFAEMSRLIQRTEGKAFRLRWRRPDSLAADSVPDPAQRVGHGRRGAMMEATVTPKYVKQGDRYVLGVGPQAIERRSYGPGEAFKAGLASAWSSTRNIVVTLKRVITGRDDLRESLGGPVMIAKVTSEAAARGPTVFWRIVAILSVTLAIMNILPIPALDGGQLLFLLYEAVTRRRPSVRVRLVAQQIGMILLLGFMAFLIFNDILRL
jgi:regulator of sigma E protease